MLRHACGYALANRGHDTRQSKDGSAIGPSPAPRSTRRWRRTGSRISGGIDQGENGGQSTSRSTGRALLISARGAQFLGLFTCGFVSVGGWAHQTIVEAQSVQVFDSFIGAAQGFFLGLLKKRGTLLV